MSRDKIKPKLRVKLTLTPYWQVKLLNALSSHLGINETYEVPHVLYMTERHFAALLCGASKDGINPTMEQLKAEYVDLNKEPQITVVRHFGEVNANYSCVELGNAADH